MPTDFVSAEVQYQTARDLIAADRLAQAKTVLEQVSYTTQEERRTIEPLVRLALADTTFYQGGDLGMIDARNLYLDFVTLNGDHPRAPYAQFQAAVCSLEQISNPAKDQTMTNQTLDDFEAGRAALPELGLRRGDPAHALESEHYLAEHDYQVGRFYMKKKNYLAATDRFRHILDHYPQYERWTRSISSSAWRCSRSDNEVEARLYLDKLITDYPDGEKAAEAKDLLAKYGGGMETELEMTP